MKHRQRPFPGLALLVTALFVLLAAHCGIVGHLISVASLRLLGTVGTKLIAVAVLMAGLLYISPVGGISKVVRRWRRLRAPKSVRKNHSASSAQPPAKVIPIRTYSAAARYEALDDVRSALLNLGYKSTEFRGLVAAMDPTRGFDTLVREALSNLRKEVGPSRQPPRTLATASDVHRVGVAHGRPTGARSAT